MNLKVLKNTKCVSVYWSDVIQPVKVMNLTILYKNYESKISNIGTRTQTTMQKANNKKKRTILCFKMRFSNHKKVF